MSVKSRGQELFISRLYDAKAKYERTGYPVLTSFLTPAQQQIVLQLCKDVPVVLDGGVAHAERAIALIGDLEGMDLQDVSDVVCLQSSLDPHAGVIEHKDVLGTLLHAGISRETFGDIFCTPQSVTLFCKESMARFVCEQVIRIKKQNIHFEKADSSCLAPIERPHFQVNCASLRYDAVVAALAHCSRKAAAEMIRQGYVKINDIILEENGRLCNNDHVSIRRCGRFQYVQTLKTTRKDRLVLEFIRYI